MLKSNVSFFRRQLKIKGGSEHNGRGSWSMGFDCSVEELGVRIEQMIERKNDMFVVERYEGRVEVKIKKGLSKDEYYRTLVFVPDQQLLAVLFTID